MKSSPDSSTCGSIDALSAMPSKLLALATWPAICVVVPAVSALCPPAPSISNEPTSSKLQAAIGAGSWRLLNSECSAVISVAERSAEYSVVLSSEHLR